MAGRRIHPSKRFKMSRNPKYLSRGRQEYIIFTTPHYMWCIRRYHGGLVPKEISGMFTRFEQAEKALISYLRKTDKFKQAIYPGSETWLEA